MYQNAIQLSQISFEVPQHEKDDQYFLDRIRWCVSFFNMPLFAAREGQTLRTQIEEMDENYLFYFGEQENSRNYFASQDNEALKFLQTDDNQIFTLVNSLHGKMCEFLQKYHISTELLSKDARTKKKAVRDSLMFMVDNQELFDLLAQLKISYNEVPEAVAIKTKEDVEEFMEYSYEEFGAIIAEEIAHLIMKISDFATLKSDQFLDLIIAGVTGTKRVIRNGLLFEEKYRPQELILDLRSNTDNNYNDAAWFRGGFKMTSPAEILDTYGEFLSNKDIAEIKACMTTTLTGYGANYVATVSQNTTGYFNYWGKGSSQYQPINSMSVVDCMWYAKYDNRYYNTKDGIKKSNDYRPDGTPINENLIKQGSYTKYRVEQGTLIGGRWLVQCGWSPNAEFDPITKKQKFPITVYIDNYTGGYYKSRVSRMKGLQLDVNLADMFIKQAEMDNLGVVALISDTGDDSTKTVESIYRNFRRMKIDMLKRDVDDDQNEILSQRFVQQIDFTKSLSVVPILEGIKAAAKNNMKTMMHLPDQAQGLQKNTIGKGVQEQTVMLASEGIAPLFNGYVNFIQRDVMLDANIQKIVTLASPRNMAIMANFIGDRGVKWLESAVQETFEYMGIYINPYDTIDGAERAKLDAKLMIYAQQQQGLTPLEDITLSQITSYRKAIIYLRRIYKQKALAAAEQQAMMMQQEAIARQEMNQTALMAKQIPADAVVESKKIQSAATSEDNARTNATKERNVDLEQQVKVLTKQLEVANKKETTS